MNYHIKWDVGHKPSLTKCSLHLWDPFAKSGPIREAPIHKSQHLEWSQSLRTETAMQVLQCHALANCITKPLKRLIHPPISVVTGRQGT